MSEGTQLEPQGLEQEVQGEPETGGEFSRSDEGNLETPSVEQVLGDGNIDWENVNLLQLKPDEVPEHVRPLLKLAKNLQRSHGRATNAARTKERELETTLAQVRAITTLQQQQQQAAQQPQSVEPAQQIQQRMARYGFTPEHELYNEYAFVQRMILDAVQEIFPHIQQVQQGVGQLSQSVQMTQAQLQSQADAQADSMLQEVYDAGHSQEDLQAWAPAWIPLVGKMNPVTNEPFTVKTAYERVAGIAGQQSQQMQQKNKRFRNDARQQSLPIGNGAAGTQNVALSQSQLEAEVGKALGLSR